VLGVFSGYQSALGVRNLSIFSSTAIIPSQHLNLCHQLISVGSYDSKIRLLTQGSAKEAFVLPSVHPRLLSPALIYTTDLYSSTTDKNITATIATENTITHGTTNSSENTIGATSSFAGCIMVE